MSRRWWSISAPPPVVMVFQPAQVRAYGGFHRQRAKNDAIDAALIAACTAATKTVRAPPTRDCRRLPNS